MKNETLYKALADAGIVLLTDIEGNAIVLGCGAGVQLLGLKPKDAPTHAAELGKTASQMYGASTCRASALAVYEAQAKQVVDEAMDAAVRACLKGEPLSEEAMRQTLAPLHELERVLRLALVRNDQAT